MKDYRIQINFTNYRGEQVGQAVNGFGDLDKTFDVLKKFVIENMMDSMSDQDISDKLNQKFSGGDFDVTTKDDVTTISLTQGSETYTHQIIWPYGFRDNWVILNQADLFYNLPADVRVSLPTKDLR